MKNRKLFWFALLAWGVILSVLVSCSIVGLVIGANTPKKYTIERRIPNYHLESLEKGTKIIVYAKGKIISEGPFSGLESVGPDSAKTKNLLIWKNVPNSSGLQGTYIPLSEVDSVMVTERFNLYKGREWNSGWDMVNIPPKTHIEIHKKDASVVVGKYLQAEKNSQTAGEETVQLKIRDFKTGSVLHVPVSEVAYVVCVGNTNQAFKGFLIGFGADVMVAGVGALIVANANPPTLNTQVHVNSPSNSCPYIYSSTGSQYQFEGEMLVGSLFKGTQRTDIMPLRALRPDEGVCHLRIANEMNETEYIDHLSLLAVDHPMGTRVVPDGNGALWAMGATLAPRKATDLSDADATADLLARDGQGWLSNPFGRNTDDPKDLRDALVLEFDRPQGIDTATLSLRLLNTAWTENLYDQFQALPGTGQEAWYQLMERSPEARNALAAAMVREMMLHVSVWDGDSWRPAGFVWAVGVTAERDVALRIPLDGTPANSGLKIRLDCLPGTWLVDCAELDYHATAAIARNIPAARATDGSGRDVSALIGAVDGQYYEMPILYQYADIEFVAPQPRLGFEQSFLVQCTGYYRPRVPATGEPQTELMERLVQEPGAFGRYALESLNGDVAEVQAELPQ